MTRRISLLVFLMLCLAPVDWVSAGHAPPPPPPPPPPDNPSMQTPDYDVPVGSPEYDFLVEQRLRHERLAPITYTVVVEGEDKEKANKPWHNLPDGLKWKDFTFPTTGDKWSVAARQMVEDLYKSRTKEKLKALEEEGLTMVRVIESTVPPEKVTKIPESILEMMKEFKGVHTQAYWLRQLVSRRANFRSTALEKLKAEKKNKAPAFPFVEQFFSNSKLREFPESTSYLEFVLGKAEFKDLSKDLKVLERVRGNNLLIKLKDKNLHPYAKALRLAGLERMTLEDVRRKGIKVYEKQQKERAELYKLVSGIDPILDLYVQFARLEAGEEVEADGIRKLVEKGDWGIRQLVAQKLETTHPDNINSIVSILLDLQRDRVRSVRTVANRTLSRLFLMGPVMPVKPEVGRDSLVVREWQKWATQREALKPPFEDKPIVIQLKQQQRNVYSPYGPANHQCLEGSWKEKKLKITIVDHDNNGRFVDYGKDNFVVGDILKPGQFLSRLVEIDGAWYHAELDEIYNRLELLPYRGKLGRLTVDAQYKKPYTLPFIIFAMGSDTTITLFKDKQGLQSHEVPAGDYTIYSSVIWDDSGPTTRVNQFHIGPGERRTIAVEDDKDTTFKIGGKIELRAEAIYFGKIGSKKKSKMARWLKITSPTFYGEGGENYRDPSYQYLMKNTKVMVNKIKGFAEEGKSKPFGLWDWNMTGTKMYEYEWYPFFKKFVKRNSIYIELHTKPGFSVEFIPFRLKAELEEVDDARFNKLLEKPTGDYEPDPEAGGGRGGEGGGGMPGGGGGR